MTASDIPVQKQGGHGNSRYGHPRGRLPRTYSDRGVPDLGLSNLQMFAIFVFFGVILFLAASESGNWITGEIEKGSASPTSQDKGIPYLKDHTIVYFRDDDDDDDDDEDEGDDDLTVSHPRDIEANNIADAAPIDGGNLYSKWLSPGPRPMRGVGGTHRKHAKAHKKKKRQHVVHVKGDGIEVDIKLDNKQHGVQVQRGDGVDGVDSTIAESSDGMVTIKGTDDKPKKVSWEKDEVVEEVKKDATPGGPKKETRKVERETGVTEDGRHITLEVEEDKDGSPEGSFEAADGVDSNIDKGDEKVTVTLTEEGGKAPGSAKEKSGTTQKITVTKKRVEETKSGDYGVYGNGSGGGGDDDDDDNDDDDDGDAEMDKQGSRMRHIHSKKRKKKPREEVVDVVTEEETEGSPPNDNAKGRAHETDVGVSVTSGE